MDDLLGALARLVARLEDLERRVSALESRSFTVASSPAQAVVPDKPAATGDELVPPQAENIFSVAGKAMLGIAGAYVLRAVAESGSFPKLAVIVLALAYAGMWLVWAARAPANARFTRVAYAVTASVILAPMLSELTLRFQVLSPAVAAGLLAAFVVGAYSLAWRGNLASVVWVAEATAVSTALALMILSHDLAPYIAALLLVAAATELAAARNRWPSLRFLAVPAVDFAVLILIYISTLPSSSRPDYAVISPSLLVWFPSFLFLIYGVSIACRTVLLRQKITIFEIAQAVIAFLSGSLGWLWFAPGVGRTTLGGACWFLSAACYTAAFFCFDRIAEQRNYHVYSTWSVALVLAGCFLLLPQIPLVLVLSLASIVAILIGVRVARLTLEFHGLIYLTAAALASSLLAYAARALAGTFPTAPGWIVWTVAVSAVVCYAIGGRFQGELWNQRLLRLLAAILAVSAVATFLVSGLVWLAAIGMTPGAAQVAVIRTLITCALALALAFSGSRWHRVELVWTAYGTLAFVTAKLLFEDLPHGHSGWIAISIFLYALALIIVPRLTRTSA